MYAITAILKFETDDLKEWMDLLECAYESKERGDIKKIKAGVKNGIYYVEEMMKEGH